jgi:hypothetical protein
LSTIKTRELCLNICPRWLRLGLASDHMILDSTDRAKTRVKSVGSTYECILDSS